MKKIKPKLKINYIFLFFIFIPLFLFSHEGTTYAASLTNVSDLISTSAPSATSTHTIQFTVTNAIPASGEVVITPQDSFFTIPPGFDYTDIDFAVATSGPFVDRSIATVPSVTEDGVSVTTGISGSVSITLNSTEGLQAGDMVQLEFGDNATFEAVGDQTITNPSLTGSYKIDIATKNQSGSTIDSANAMISVVSSVAVSSAIIAQAPIRSNGLPSGSIAAGSASVELSLNTNETATCKYATTTNVVYASMANTFSTTGGTLHTVVENGLQNGASYNYYIRCIDTNGNANDDDFIISFSIKTQPQTAGGGGSAGRGGSGAFFGGSQFLFKSSVTLGGWAYPISTVTILKDGKKYKTIQTASDGSFSETVDNLERGTYTFIVFAKDRNQRKSATFSSTLSLGQGTNNSISNVVISPTIELESDTVGVGDTAVVFGESVPGSIIELFVKRQSNVFSIGDAKKFTASSTRGVPNIPDGSWSISFDTNLFDEGTYEVRARTIVSEKAESDFSRVLFLGIGGAPEPDFSLRADINKDGKVNLVDFSILLVYWNTSNADSDINSDGVVNLADFSIILFYWTG